MTVMEVARTLFRGLFVAVVLVALFGEPDLFDAMGLARHLVDLEAWLFSVSEYPVLLTFAVGFAMGWWIIPWMTNAYGPRLTFLGRSARILSTDWGPQFEMMLITIRNAPIKKSRGTEAREVAVTVQPFDLGLRPIDVKFGESPWRDSRGPRAVGNQPRAMRRASVLSGKDEAVVPLIMTSAGEWFGIACQDLENQIVPNPERAVRQQLFLIRIVTNSDVGAADATAWFVVHLNHQRGRALRLMFNFDNKLWRLLWLRWHQWRPNDVPWEALGSRRGA